MNNGEISKVINISAKSLEGRSNFISYSWQSDVIFDSARGEFVPLTKKLKAEARQKGDYSYVKKGLFKRVYINKDGVLVPLTQVDKKGYVNYVYRMINAWGDSYRANESYDYIRMSVLDNGYERLEAAFDDSQKQIRAGESTDDEIVAALNADTETETTPSTQPSGSVEKTNKIIVRSELKANPTTLYLFGDNDIRKGLGGQAKEMRGESNAIGISTKKLPANNEKAYKSDVELEENKRIITEDINKAIAEWSTGKYNKLIIPQMGVGLAELPTRAPETYKFLQQELKRLEDQIIKPLTNIETDVKRRRAEDNKKPSRQSVKYKLQNKIAGIDNPTIGNEIATLSDAIKIAGDKITTPIKINEGEITHIVFDQGESNFEFTYKGKKFAAFYTSNVKGNARWEITKLDPKSNTYKYISLDELKNINEKYGSQKDLLLSIGIKDLVNDIENFEKVEYTTEDKSYGIIPLENTVSAEQIKLGKKYGVSYTLEDFIKEYDAELASLDTTQPSTSLSPEEIKDIQTKIVRIETAIENGVADQREYASLDNYRKQLGLSPIYELTSENFEDSYIDKNAPEGLPAIDRTPPQCS
jgi:hypothetical protein